MKRALFSVMLAGAMLFAACAPAQAPSPETASPAMDAAVETFSLLLPPGEQPPAAASVPEASPMPTAVPAIQADWYTQRNDELVRLMQRNGAFSSEDEVLAAVARMDIDPDKPMIALTFDDGPTAGVTGKILDVLAKYNARATFFVVGNRIAGNESLLRRAVALGCEIGNHTWDHLNLKKASRDDAKASIEKTNEAVFDATGYRVKSLRPPEGASNDDVKQLAGALDMSLVFWCHSTHDYRMKSAERIAELVFYDSENEHTLCDGDIVLMHDLRSYTADAMEDIVSRLVAEGYQLVTVQELLQLSADGYLPGKSYKRQ